MNIPGFSAEEGLRPASRTYRSGSYDGLTAVVELAQLGEDAAGPDAEGCYENCISECANAGVPQEQCEQQCTEACSSQGAA